MKIHPICRVSFDASMKRLKEQFTIEKSDVAVFEPGLVAIPFSQHVAPQPSTRHSWGAGQKARPLPK